MVLGQHWQMDEEGGAAAATGEYLLRSLLGARKDADFPSNEVGFDEDVNVYLVGLLGRFLSAAWHEEASRYLHPHDLDLSRAAEDSPDPRHAYRLYKVNADHLLVGIGLFRHVEGASQPGHPLFHREVEEYIGRGGLYYSMASSRLRRLRRQDSGTEEALRKLGEGFARYVEVLGRLRGAYFHLMERLGEGSLYHLARDAGETADLPRLYDAFLDRLSEWKATPDEAHRTALAQAARRLAEVDEGFSFEVPAEGERPAG